MVLRQKRDVTMKHGFSEVGGETVVRDVGRSQKEQNTNNWCELTIRYFTGTNSKENFYFHRLSRRDMA